MPYAGNPPAYVASLSTTTGVTQGSQAPSGNCARPGIWRARSAAFTDAGRATTINNSPYMLIDMTVPQKGFNFGNIDVTFFQTGIRGPGNDADETGFSPTFAAVVWIDGHSPDSADQHAVRYPAYRAQSESAVVLPNRYELRPRGGGDGSVYVPVRQPESRS